MNRDKAAYDEPFTERPTLVGHGFDSSGVSLEEKRFSIEAITF